MERKGFQKWNYYSKKIFMVTNEAWFLKFIEYGRYLRCFYSLKNLPIEIGNLEVYERISSIYC
jgi:hypothetical protein